MFIGFFAIFKNRFCFFLLSLFFFGLLNILLFYQAVYAADQYFFDDFKGSSIDSNKWDTSNLISGKRWCADDIYNQFVSGLWLDVAASSCHGAIQSLPFGNVTVANGEAAFSSGWTRTFPYMWSGPPNFSPFSTAGDFVFEMRLKYNSISLHGAGAVAINWANTIPDGNNPPTGLDGKLFSIWADRQYLFVNLLGDTVYLSNPLNYHTYRLEYKDGKYSLFVDNQLRFNSISSALRPTSILIGNPVFAFWNSYDWSDFSLDYIKVTGVDLPAPAPFLDLPWDYEEKGLSFNEAALAMSSFFDHEYPLLSSGLSEPSGIQNSVVYYNGGERSFDRDYSSHDGYDYARGASVNIGDSVLAAAGGIATYINSCTDCGNMIVIDHGNGYQTKYMHLQKDGLITNIPGEKVRVNAKQQIGKVGATGNVAPPGDEGAHIHFAVFQDKNNDGNFEDNIPDGVTDPFGWQSEDPDPWKQYAFFYNSQQRTGNSSYYLWKKNLSSVKTNLTSSGGIFTNDRYKLDFSQNSTSQNLTIELKSEPTVKSSNLIRSIGSALMATAKDAFGNLVTQFLNPFTLTIDFTQFDLTGIKPDSLSVYSSPDGINWNKENTAVDLVNRTASAQLNHFTHFALMAERKDTTPPATNAVLLGLQGQQNWFRSDVQVSLNTQDNEDGLGIDYTLYKIEGGDWEIYTRSLNFSNEGHYKIYFYSNDKDGNIEDVKTVEFDIDKTSPEAEIKYNTETFDLEITGKDSSDSAVVTMSALAKDKQKITITDKAGNTLNIIGKNKEKEKEGTKIVLESLRYNEGEVIDLDPAKLSIEANYNENGENQQKLEQRLEIRGELKIKLQYLVNKNKTRVITKIKGQEKIKEELEGMRILKLTTEKGKLNYSY